MFHSSVTVSVLALSAGCSALAQHAGDIVLTIEGGSIVTNLAAPGVPERVFASDFGEFVPDFTNEPGFDSPPGTFLVPSQIGFDIPRALRVWWGSGFGLIPPETIEIGFSVLTPIVTPPADSPVRGFSLPVGANGQWHRHLEYTLSSPASRGIYLLELSLWSTMGSTGASRPFWIVFNQGEDEATHASAIAFVRATLAGCAADFNADGSLDFFDYADFVSCFAGEVCPPERSADFNTDRSVDFFDYLDFVSAFEDGCG
jgi:hypothetical protein